MSLSNIIRALKTMPSLPNPLRCWENGYSVSWGRPGGGHASPPSLLPLSIQTPSWCSVLWPQAGPTPYSAVASRVPSLWPPMDPFSHPGRWAGSRSPYPFHRPGGGATPRYTDSLGVTCCSGDPSPIPGHLGPDPAQSPFPINSESL